MAYFVKSTRSIGLTQSVLHFNFKSGYQNYLKIKDYDKDPKHPDNSKRSLNGYMVRAVASLYA
jgi:hypothetical protein